MSAARTDLERNVTHPWSPIAGLATMLLALMLIGLSGRSPAPEPVTAAGHEFSAARAMVLVERLLGDGSPHPVGSAANTRVGQRIDAELTELGYPVETQKTFACSAIWAQCGHVTNLIGRLPGQIDGPAVLLTAHYDSVPAGPGAADDMAGVAAILEIARILRAEPPPRNPVIFLFSDGEEPGMLGAEAFANAHPWAAQIGVVVNLEASGTSGQSVLFESTRENAWLIDVFAAHAPRPVASSLYDELFKFLPLNTDLTVYEAAGMPGINFAFVEQGAQYHTPLDNLANLDPGSVQHHGDNALASVRAFAARDLTEPPSGRGVYLDVAPGVVLHWPESWTVWIALACVLAWSGFAVSVIRRGELPWRGVLWGLGVLPAGILSAVLLGLALTVGVGFLRDAPAPWYAEPLPMRVALWTGALLCLALAAAAVARRSGFWGLTLGVWLWWSVLSFLVAWWTPGFSVMFLLPTVLATLVLLAVALTPLRALPHARETAAVTALFGASWFWLSFALGIESSGAGSETGPMVAFAAAFAASALTPLLALPVAVGKMQRWPLAGVALLVLAAAGAALLVPTYSAASPQRLNLLHVDDRASGQAFWALDGDVRPDQGAADVPEALWRSGGFAPQPVAVFPWSSDRNLVAPAARSGEPAPAVRLLEDDRVAGGRVIHLQLRSPRGGHQLSLYVPEEAGLQRITLPGTPYAIETIPAEDGYQAFHYFAPEGDGLTVALHLESSAPLTVYVVDASSALPPGGEDLISARPDIAVPSHEGDTSLIVDRVTVGAS